MTALSAPARPAKARKRVFAVLALLGAWAVLAISGATPALAHATVVGSDPAESSRLQSPPSKVTMTFSEDVSLGAGYLKVVDSKSNIVSNGEAKVQGRNVTVPLKSGLGDGSYIVSYRITSADSHPIGGAYAFVVGDGPLVAATGSVVGGGTNGVITKIFDAARFVGFLGIVLLAGLVFVVLCWPAGRTDPRARRLIWYGWWATIAGAVLGLVLQGPYAAGTGLLDLLNTSLLKTTLGTTYGRMLCARLILLGVLAVLAVRILREPQRTAELAEALPRYSRLALGCVAVLAVTGTYQAWREVWPIPALWSTGATSPRPACGSAGWSSWSPACCRAGGPASWPRRCRATPGWRSAAWPCSP